MSESQRNIWICSAGSTEIPALLTLRAKGIHIWLEYHQDQGFDHTCPWHVKYKAEKDGAHFLATTALELLGLVAMWEARVDDWEFQKGEPNILDELMNLAKSFDSDGNVLPDE